MNQVRLFDNPEEFAEMMMKHLSDALKVTPKQDKKEPLLISFSLGEEDEVVQISLHSAFQTYMNTGDLNLAIDHLNGIISGSQACRDKDEMIKLDLSCVYPTLRDSRYVTEAGKATISEKILPGLSMIFIEKKEGYSKMINQTLLDHQSNLTQERLKRVAFQNMRSEGWTKPSLSLPSPARESCVMDVYTDYYSPIECQFITPGWTKMHLPHSYLIAFTNRKTVVAMRSSEEMDTIELARELAVTSQYTEIVRRSHVVMPHPNSEHIYWLHKGKLRKL